LAGGYFSDAASPCCYRFKEIDYDHIRKYRPAVSKYTGKLNPKLVENPYAVLEWFFYPTDVIPKYRVWMALWLMDAIRSPIKPKRRHLLKAFYNFSHMAKLLDALWIIYQQGDRFSPEDIAVRGDLDSYDIIWSERVHDHMRFENYAQTDFFPELLDVEDEKAPLPLSPISSHTMTCLMLKQSWSVG
jgi:hypothetical protein